MICSGDITAELFLIVDNVIMCIVDADVIHDMSSDGCVTSHFPKVKYLKQFSLKMIVVFKITNFIFFNDTNKSSLVQRESISTN